MVKIEAALAVYSGSSCERTSSTRSETPEPGSNDTAGANECEEDAVLVRLTSVK